MVIVSVFAVSAAPSSPLSVDVGPDPFPVIPVSRGGMDAEWVDGEVLVKLKRYISAADVNSEAAESDFQALNTRLGVEVAEAIPVTDIADIYRVKIAPTMSVEEAVLIYQASPFVEYANLAPRC